jgi:hypothetical protein
MSVKKGYLMSGVSEVFCVGLACAFLHWMLQQYCLRFANIELCSMEGRYIFYYGE